jgi:hypothetical protein
MRRAAATAVAALALTFLGAACGHAKATPGVPHRDFTPKAELLVSGSDLHVSGSGQDASEAAVSHVPQGSVLLIKNDDTHNRQVVGSIKDAQLFDTGTMHPGQSTTVVLDAPGKVTMTEPATGQHTTLTVTALPAKT